MQEARLVGDEFLALEKYVNLNYLVSALNAQHLAGCLGIGGEGRGGGE